MCQIAPVQSFTVVKVFFSVLVGPQFGLHILPNAVDLTRFTGVFFRRILQSIWLESYFFKSLKFSLVLFIYSLFISVRAQLFKASLA